MHYLSQPSDQRQHVYGLGHAQVIYQSSLFRPAVIHIHGSRYAIPMWHTIPLAIMDGHYHYHYQVHTQYLMNLIDSSWCREPTASARRVFAVGKENQPSCLSADTYAFRATSNSCSNSESPKFEICRSLRTFRNVLYVCMHLWMEYITQYSDLLGEIFVHLLLWFILGICAQEREESDHLSKN